MSKTRHTHAGPLDLRAAARHVMVDFNQMQTFTENPLIMVEGERDPAHGPRGPTVHRRALGRLRGQPRARERGDRRRDRGAAPSALLLVADHDDDRPRARAGDRVAPRHRRQVRRRQAALERVGGHRRRDQDGAPVPPPERQRRALQDDLVLPLLPRRDDGRSHLDGLAAATDAVRAVRRGRPACAPADPGIVPGLHGLLHARLPCAAPRRDRARGPPHGVGRDRRAGDADRRRPRALGRLPPRVARALRRDGRAPDLRRDRDRVRSARLLVRRGAGRRLAGHPRASARA